MVFDHAQLKTLVREITVRIHATSLSTDSDLTSRLSFLEETINSFCHDNQLTQHTLSLRGAQITALQEKPTGCEGQLEGLEVVLEQLGEQLTTSLGQVNILNARIVELELASTFTQHSSVQVNTSHPLGSAPTPHSFLWKPVIAVTLLTMEATGYIFGHPFRPYVTKKAWGVSKKILGRGSLPAKLLPPEKGVSSSYISVDTTPILALPPPVL